VAKVVVVVARRRVAKVVVVVVWWVHWGALLRGASKTLLATAVLCPEDTHLDFFG
jgi:hypothetical protein